MNSLLSIPRSFISIIKVRRVFEERQSELSPPNPPEVHPSRNPPPQTAKGKKEKAKNSPTASGTLENMRKNGQKINFPLRFSNLKLQNFLKNFISEWF